MEFVHRSSKKQSSLLFRTGLIGHAKLQSLLNYSRKNSPHYELLALETNFPNKQILEEFQNGNFSIQMSTGNPFGRMEADKVLETTINKYTKTPGGTTGMFHSLKSQNTVRCRNYLWKKSLQNSFYIYFFEI